MYINHKIYLRNSSGLFIRTSILGVFPPSRLSLRLVSVFPGVFFTIELEQHKILNLKLFL